MRRAALVVAVAFSLAACHRAAAPAAPAASAIGETRAVVSRDGETAVFGAGGVSLVVAGGKPLVDATTPFEDGALVPSPSGGRAWIVGVRSDGVVVRVHPDGALEPVSALLGLAGLAVRSVRALSDGRVAFAHDAGLALYDGKRTRLVALRAGKLLAASPRALVLATARDVRAVDPATLAVRAWPLEDARRAETLADGRLRVETARATYETDTRGALVRAAPTTAASPTASSRWDAAPGPAAGGASRWDATIAPVFARACSSCHGPGGVAGVRLDAEAGWIGHRDAIRRRVVDERTMPPPGHPLAPADRDAVRAWVDGG